MKSKIKDIITGASIAGVIAAGSYMMMKSKKNMLDVIIEEIETMK